jgi:hypothetical protein
MTLATYAELKQAIRDYSSRSLTLFETNIPVFIHYAHTELMRELRIPLLQASADLTISASSVALPSDFRATARLWIDSGYDEPLSPATLDQVLRARTMQTPSRPTIFSREGSNMAFGPVPDTTYTGKLLYYRQLPAMTADADTNDLLVRYPFAYLYGALSAAASFDKFTEDEAAYEARFRAQISQINMRERADAMSGGPIAPTITGAIA